VRSESIDQPELEKIIIENRLTWHPPAEGATAYDDSPKGYRRYAHTENGVSPVAIPGTPGGQYVGMVSSTTRRPATVPIPGPTPR